MYELNVFYRGQFGNWLEDALEFKLLQFDWFNCLLHRVGWKVSIRSMRRDCELDTKVLLEDG